MKYLNYVLILVGAFIAFYAKSGADQNQYILIGGIVLLMIGIYRISKTIPSRKAAEDENNTNNNSENNPENN